MKILRFGLVGIWFAIVSLASLPVFFIRFKNTSNNRIFSRMLVGPMLRILGVRVEVSGYEKLYAHQPCVYVVNHQSNLDIVIHSMVYPKRTVAIGKRSLMRIPIFGWLMYLGGNLLVDRRNHTNTMGAMRIADEAITRDGTSIWFFPEGTRNHGRGLRPFKKGAFVCAAANEVPLVCILASRFRGNLDFGKWKAGTVRIEVLDPIATTRADLDNIDVLIARVRNTFEEVLGRLDGPEKIS